MLDFKISFYIQHKVLRLLTTVAYKTSRPLNDSSCYHLPNEMMKAASGERDGFHEALPGNPRRTCLAICEEAEARPLLDIPGRR